MPSKHCMNEDEIGKRMSSKLGLLQEQAFCVVFRWHISIVQPKFVIFYLRACALFSCMNKIYLQRCIFYKIGIFVLVQRNEANQL